MSHNHLVTTLIVNHRDEILMMLRDIKPGIANPGNWAFIGGHIEYGETPADAAAREIHEETSISIAVKDLKTLTVLREKNRQKYVFYVTGQWKDSDIIRGEGQEMRFVPLDQVQRLAMSHEHKDLFNIFLAEKYNRGLSISEAH